MQPEINIGMVGHVDHGKTVLVNTLTGEWTDKHSEEIKRGISIRLGYADATFRKCPYCKEPESYTISERCEHCGAPTEILKTVSFVDAPGHEALMAVMLSGAAIIYGAILVIAANEPCPQPQTKEHLMALEILDVRNIIVVQNKIDLVSREEAIEHYHQIKSFLEGTIAENAPIVPVSAQQNANVDLLIQLIIENIPTPSRAHERRKSPIMPIVRSFDINMPGTAWNKIQGGVFGGSIKQGILCVNDEIAISPGIHRGKGWMTLETSVTSLMSGSEEIPEAIPGGLVGVGTELDPAMTKGDALSGQLAGYPRHLPPVWDEFTMDLHLFSTVIGSKRNLKVSPIEEGEVLMLNIGTATTTGIVTKGSGDEVEVELRRPVCIPPGEKVAINRLIKSRYYLIGYGILQE